MSLRCRSRRARVVAAAVVVCMVAAVIGCDREQRQFRVTPPGASPVPPPGVRMSDNHAGTAAHVTRAGPEWGDNAYHMAEGKRLYAAFNCVGCHAHGGGGIGPPLMDNQWIYGSEPQNIFATIVEGRPNGMPSFGGKLTTQQIWQLVFYVRSMSGLGRLDARPGRSDGMAVKPPENMMSRQDPQAGAAPQSR